MAVPLKVIVADDDVLVRAGIEGLLGTFTDIRISASCGSLSELLQAVEATPTNVVLTDIRMPPGHGTEGVQAAQQLRETHPDIGVVVLSQYVDPQLAYAVLQDGSRGRGYLLKEHVADGDYLVDALRSVAAGGSFIDSDVLDNLLSARTNGAGTELAQLTPREAEVLDEVAAGYTNATIAERLFIGERAVEKHISAIFSKLGLTSSDERHKRVAAVLLCLAGRSGVSDRSVP